MRKSTVVVFDEGASVDAIGAAIGAAAVTLAPLTSDFNLIAALSAGRSIEVEELGSRVDSAFAELRQPLVEWIADAGARLGPELLSGGVSGWWFSLLAEKNPLTSDIWLDLARVAAVGRLIDQIKPSHLVIAVSSEGLCDSIAASAAARGVATEIVRTRSVRWRGTIEPLKSWAELGRRGLRSWRVRRRVGAAAYFPPHSVLIVSYFPSLERRLDDQPFRTRYFSSLESALTDGGVPLGWAFLYAPLDGANFSGAVDTLASFREAGQPANLLDQYLDRRAVAAVSRNWRTYTEIVRRNREKVTETILQSLPVPEARAVVTGFLSKALLGARAFQGFVFFEIFRRMFDENRTITECIYTAEFQPWEAALCAARDAAGVSTRLVGYQHTTVPLNLLNYRHATREFVSTPAEGGRPLPDVIVANGPVGLERLGGWGGSRVVEGEALRHLHVKDLGESAPAETRPARVLVAGSISRAETRALIGLLAQAAPGLAATEIWIKGHPACPVEPLLRERSLALPERWRVVTESIDESLRQVRVAIVLSTTVGLEALAAGCAVIRPLFPDVLSTSPLDGFEERYERVSTPAELAAAVGRGLDGEVTATARHFARNYWTLDPLLPRWRTILGLEPAA